MKHGLVPSRVSKGKGDDATSTINDISRNTERLMGIPGKCERRGDTKKKKSGESRSTIQVRWLGIRVSVCVYVCACVCVCMCVCVSKMSGSACLCQVQLMKAIF